MSKRKAYKPKPCVLPLGMRRADKMEIPGYQASIALGQPHFCEQHVYDLLSNADLVKRIAPAGHAIRALAQEMIHAIADIQARSERVGKLGVNGDELRTLREGLARTMAYLRGVPNIKMARASMAALAEFDKTGVLRV